MPKHSKYTVLLLLIITLAACSSPSTGSEEPSTSSDFLNLADLSNQTSLNNLVDYGVEDIDLLPEEGLSLQGAQDINLSQVAQVEAPVVEGEQVQATSIVFQGDKAIVSYNMQGEKYLGALDIIDMSDATKPQLIRRLSYPSADVNAIHFDNDNVYAVLGGEWQDVDNTAFVQVIPWQDGTLDLDNSKVIALEGYVANSVLINSGAELDGSDAEILVTSGNDGGLNIITKSDLKIKESKALDDARWVDFDDNYLVVVQGTPGRLAVFDRSTLELERTIDILNGGGNQGLNATEAKATVELHEGKAFVANGNWGFQVYDPATGQRLGGRLGVKANNNDFVVNSGTIKGDYAFVAAGQAGVYVTDYAPTEDGKVSFPTFMQLVFEESSSANHVTYKDNYLFVAAGKSGVRIVAVDAPESDKIIITADNAYELYINGNLIGSGDGWRSAEIHRVELEPSDVIAIKAIDTGGPASVLAEIVVDDRRLGTSADFKLSRTEEANWQAKNFNDEAWEIATEHSAYNGVNSIDGGWAFIEDMPSDTVANWIWAADRYSVNEVYLRYTIPEEE